LAPQGFCVVIEEYVWKHLSPATAAPWIKAEWSPWKTKTAL
jgi:hypothetical protein